MRCIICFWIWYVWEIENSNLHWAMGSTFRKWIYLRRIRLSPQGRIERLLDQIESNESGGEEKKGKSIKQRSN
jgi:hypothetical protein